MKESRTYVFRGQKDLLPVDGAVFRLLWRSACVLLALLVRHPGHLDVDLLLVEPHVCGACVELRRRVDLYS